MGLCWLLGLFFLAGCIPGASLLCVSVGNCSASSSPIFLCLGHTGMDEYQARRGVLHAIFWSSTEQLLPFQTSDSTFACLHLARLWLPLLAWSCLSVAEDYSCPQADKGFTGLLLSLGSVPVGHCAVSAAFSTHAVQFLMCPWQ